MFKCPNCGSSAQFKISTPLYYKNGGWQQQKKCECGCVVVLEFTEHIKEVIYPEKKGE